MKDKKKKKLTLKDMVEAAHHAGVHISFGLRSNAIVYKYVLAGDGRMAQVIHSEMNYREMRAHICKCLKDDIFMLGTLAFKHPDLKMADDYLSHCPIMM